MTTLKTHSWKGNDVDHAKIIRDTWDRAKAYSLDFEKCPTYRFVAVRSWVERYEESKSIDELRPVEPDVVEFRARTYVRRGSMMCPPESMAIEGEYRGVSLIVEEWDIT